VTEKGLIAGAAAFSQPWATPLEAQPAEGRGACRQAIGN
jgi:hypothetical protein